MQQKIRKAFYAGSFNPFHIGHLDILRQAEKMFDEVIIGVGQNLNKPTLMSAQLVTHIQSLKLVNSVVGYGQDLATALKSYREPVALIRGIRNSHDLVAEASMNTYLRALIPGLSIVYLFPSAENAHVSSSAIRELLSIGSTDSLTLARKFTVQVPGGSTWSANVTPPSQPPKTGGIFDSLKNKP